MQLRCNEIKSCEESCCEEQVTDSSFESVYYSSPWAVSFGCGEEKTRMTFGRDAASPPQSCAAQGSQWEAHQRPATKSVQLHPTMVNHHPLARDQPNQLNQTPK